MLSTLITEGRALLEGTEKTAEDVAAELTAALKPLMLDRVFNVRVRSGMTGGKSVYVDAYSYTNDKSTWVSGILLNAPVILMLDLEYWLDGVPSSMSGFGKFTPSDGKIALSVGGHTRLPKGMKPRQMTGPVAKVVASVIAWFKKNRDVFFKDQKEAREGGFSAGVWSMPTLGESRIGSGVWSMPTYAQTLAAQPVSEAAPSKAAVVDFFLNALDKLSGDDGEISKAMVGFGYSKSVADGIEKAYGERTPAEITAQRNMMGGEAAVEKWLAKTVKPLEAGEKTRKALILKIYKKAKSVGDGEIRGGKHRVMVVPLDRNVPFVLEDETDEKLQQIADALKV